MDTVRMAKDEGKAVVIVYLNFVKAFDKVPKQRLLKNSEQKE
jgi:hypothetical protein